MGCHPNALLQAIIADLSEYCPFGPVGLGDIPPDASYKQFASTYLISSFLKKLETRNNEKADAAAKEKFLTSNKTCENWRLEDRDELTEELYNLFVKELDDFFHPQGQMLFSSYDEILTRGRVGPGSAVGANGFSMYAKLFASRLTTTSAMLYSAYRTHIEQYERHYEADFYCRSALGSARYVRGSRTSFAPKTVDCSRLICVEPSLNMFVQLGVGALLEDRLRDYYKIDLSTQPEVNRWLSRAGSKSGEFATIDLSSASDSISINMLKATLPSWFFETLMEIRSPVTSFGKEVVTLNMISTMGNGFTFPLQTVIFTSLIRAVYRSLDIPIENGRHHWNHSCFGDDLIVSKLAFNRVIRLLSYLGFSVNNSKTFSEGPFRESCGSDWFVGQPVRPVYLKRLTSLQDHFVTINQLNNWSSYTGIPLPKAVATVMAGIRPEVLSSCYVPAYENSDAGIRAPAVSLPRSAIVWDRNKSMIYRPFRPIPKAVRVEEGRIRLPGGKKELLYNPSGLLESFLYGELRSGSFMVRHDHVRYRRKATCSPCWDYVPLGVEVNGYLIPWPSWESSVVINMTNPC